MFLLPLNFIFLPELFPICCLSCITLTIMILFIKLRGKTAGVIVLLFSFAYYFQDIKKNPRYLLLLSVLCWLLLLAVQAHQTYQQILSHPSCNPNQVVYYNYVYYNQLYRTKYFLLTGCPVPGSMRMGSLTFFTGNKCPAVFDDGIGAF